MRLRFFDGRAASVSTGGIDNNNTLSDSFGQPAAGLVEGHAQSCPKIKGRDSARPSRRSRTGVERPVPDANFLWSSSTEMAYNYLTAVRRCYELFRAGERVLFRRSFGQRVVA